MIETNFEHRDAVDLTEKKCLHDLNGSSLHAATAKLTPGKRDRPHRQSRRSHLPCSMVGEPRLSSDFRQPVPRNIFHSTSLR